MKKNIEKMYKSGEVAKITGVDGRRIGQIIHKQQVIPTVESRGQGRAAQFSIEDMTAIFIIATLCEYGLSSKLASRIARKSVAFAALYNTGYEYHLYPGVNINIEAHVFLKTVKQEVQLYEKKYRKD